MQPFDILDPNLDIFQSRFLEASAGTGKTFAIEHLVIRLLLESDPPISLKEILAVTFTREATHEMKSRIRAKLEKTISQDKEEMRRIREALSTFDEIPIFTIHGFCHKMLQEFAFEAEVPLKITDPDKPDHTSQLRQVVEDFFRTADPEFAPDVTFLLKRSRFDLERVIQKIINRIEKEETPASRPEMAPLPLFSLQDLKEDFLTLAPRYKRLKVEDYAPQIEKFAAFAKAPSVAGLLEEKDWFFEKMQEDNAKVKAAPLENYSLRAPGIFHALHKTLTPILQKARDENSILARIAFACQKRYRVKQARKDLFSFDDLLKKMDSALDHEAFLEKVSSKYKVAIIDEFQDTDPIQWNIFKRLFLQNHLLYLVGDPKQSIYGFRSADIYTYMQAAKALGEEKKAILDTNFRSSPKLVASLNTLFTKNPDWIALPSLPDALTYHPVKAGRTESKIEEAPIQGFAISGTQGREKNWPTKEMEEKQLFPYIAREMIRLHEIYDFSFEQMVILVKDRFVAHRCKEHLNKWNIPAAIKRSANLSTTRGFLAMEMLLQAVCNPEDESSVCQVLFSPLIGLKEKETHPFFAFKELVEEKGFPAFYETFIQTKFGEKTPLQTLLAQPDISLYREFSQTAEILMQKPIGSCDTLLAFMEELKSGHPENDERLKLRLEGENKASIMTTFASKGLEFEVVFALDMASRRSQEEDEEKEAEKMRQLYVALTRSREKLYLPLIYDEQKKPISPGSGSPLEIFFSDWEEFPFPVETVSAIPITPYAKQEKEILLEPPPPVDLTFETSYLTSFSTMAKPHHSTLLREKFKAQDLTKKSLHTMPLGAETGTVIHFVFETLFQDRSISIEQVVFETLAGTHLTGYEEIITDMTHDILQMPLKPGLTLESLQEEDYFQEMEFLFPDGNKLIKGFADLVFKKEDKFYLIDWKTNWLGPNDSDYSQGNIEKAMHEHDYFLQASLYTKALERYVKQFYNSPFQDQFGGAFYLFIRGKQGYYINDRSC